MILETVCVGAFAANCYILAAEAGQKAIIIDPGDEADKIRSVLEKHKLEPGIIINTHGHIDHIGSDEKFGVPIYIHEKDLSLLKDPGLNLSTFLSSSFNVTKNIHALRDKENLEFAKIELEVIHLPGHTPGGIALLLKKPKNKILFSGDSLFFRGIGRTDFPQADGDLLVKSIKARLFHLDDETIVYPGHGPSSTIGEEKRDNPFLV